MAGAKKDTRKASEMETKPAAKASKKQKVVEPVVEVLNDKDAKFYSCIEIYWSKSFEKIFYIVHSLSNLF
jgi:hypothetical protein